MPVGNQWKAKAKEEAAAKAAAAAAPAVEEQKASDQGKRIGGSRFRSKAGGDAKQETPAQDAVADEVDGSKIGRSRSVAGKWAASQDDQKTSQVVRRKRLEVTEAATGDEGDVEMDPANAGIILENEPVRLEGVVRSDDPSEFQKPLELEKGWAKNLASRFQQQQQDDQQETKKSFKLDVEIGAEAEIHENEPEVLDGVVRSSDRTTDVISKRGTIKNIAGKFASGQVSVDDQNGNNSSSSRERPTPSSRRSVLERFERGPIDSDGSVVAENQPEELDPNIVRSTDGYRANDPVMKAGRIRNMADRFHSQKPVSDESDDDAPAKSSKPAWLVELEKAKEAETKVFENEPEVRDDVVRADDDTPDIISVQYTRNLRKMWNQIEREKDAAEQQPKNRPPPLVVRPKEPTPEPEPPKPPPEEQKPARFGARRTIGRLPIGQLQKEEPAKLAQQTAIAPETGKGRQSAGFGAVGKLGGRQQQQQTPPTQQPLEVEAKASKFNVRPTLKSVHQLRK